MSAHASSTPKADKWIAPPPAPRTEAVAGTGSGVVDCLALLSNESTVNLNIKHDKILLLAGNSQIEFGPTSTFQLVSEKADKRGRSLSVPKPAGSAASSSHGTPRTSTLHSEASSPTPSSEKSPHGPGRTRAATVSTSGPHK